MYVNPRQKAVQLEEGIELDDKEAQQQFDEFYEDVFTELGNFGELEEMHVTGNLGDHLTGNVYAKFRREEDAATALTKLHGRFYAGRPLIGEFSPVTDFREARCRQYDDGECARGGYCNFIHPVRPSRGLMRELFSRQRQQFPRSRSRSSSRSPRRSRSRSPPPRGGGGGGGGGGRRGGYRGGGGGGGRDFRGDREYRDRGGRRDDRDERDDRRRDDRERDRDDRDDRRRDDRGDRDREKERDGRRDERRERDSREHRDKDGRDGRERTNGGGSPPDM